MGDIVCLAGGAPPPRVSRRATGHTGAHRSVQWTWPTQCVPPLVCAFGGWGGWEGQCCCALAGIMAPIPIPIVGAQMAQMASNGPNGPRWRRRRGRDAEREAQPMTSACFFWYTPRVHPRIAPRFTRACGWGRCADGPPCIPYPATLCRYCLTAVLVIIACTHCTTGHCTTVPLYHSLRPRGATVH